jgi:ribulose-phosphate 3-epimerase
VTAADPHTYREQMARIEPFAERVHIDFADGEFAPKLVDLDQAYWPGHIVADLHLMYRNPTVHLETIIGLKPNLVIVHAESEGDLLGMLLQLRQAGIKVGVALLNETQPEEHGALLAIADHILIFSGDLGHFGGHADMKLLSKVAGVKSISPTAELGWDGGVSAENTPALADGGIDVLDSGGFIQKAENPKQAYEELVGLTSHD